jgi:hypothetical protein
MVEATGSAYAVIAPPIPWEIPYIIGDCIQNLRSSLDYLARELCVRTGNDPAETRAAFPVCSTPKCFRDEIDRSLMGLNQPMRTAIEEIQPYKTGQGVFSLTNLWILHDLCNVNKHRRILLAVLKVWDLPYGDGGASASDVEVNREFVASIAFDEGTAKAREVLGFTNEMISYVEAFLLPRFEKFF